MKKIRHQYTDLGFFGIFNSLSRINAKIDHSLHLFIGEINSRLTLLSYMVDPFDHEDKGSFFRFKKDLSLEQFYQGTCNIDLMMINKDEASLVLQFKDNI